MVGLTHFVGLFMTWISSYNRINGTYTCENNEVQNKLLKEELGFQGL